MIEMGIAEQNLVGVSAGLAAAGKKVFAVSPACFLTTRSLEQVKNDVAYSNQLVKVVGISAGVSYGALGTTHHSLHDLAVLQAIHNIDIVVPADNFETEQAIRQAVEHPRPLYLRFGKKAMPDLHAPGTTFQIGKAIPLRLGSEVALIAIGETVHPALQAADLLAEQGITCSVLSLHTLRPLDEEAILETMSNCRALVTVEEHSVNGGLGSRIAALLMQQGLYRPMRIAGIPDAYTITGSQTEVFRYYGISPEGLAEAANRLLQGQ
jgi:transketolase